MEQHSPFVPAETLGYAHIVEHIRECWLANGQSGATAFPPPMCPMWGRDREGGTTSNGPCLRSETQSPHSRYLEPAQDLLRTVCFVATPLPVPPPHGAHFSTDIAVRVNECCAAIRLLRCDL